MTPPHLTPPLPLVNKLLLKESSQNSSVGVRLSGFKPATFLLFDVGQIYLWNEENSSFFQGNFKVNLEKTLMLGKIEGRRRRGWQRMRWLDSITNSIDMNLSKLQEIVKDREAWHAAVHGIAKSQTWLRDWTTILRLKWVNACKALRIVPGTL